MDLSNEYLKGLIEEAKKRGAERRRKKIVPYVWLASTAALLAAIKFGKKYAEQVSGNELTLGWTIVHVLVCAGVTAVPMSFVNRLTVLLINRVAAREKNVLTEADGILEDIVRGAAEDTNNFLSRIDGSDPLLNVSLGNDVVSQVRQLLDDLDLCASGRSKKWIARRAEVLQALRALLKK